MNMLYKQPAEIQYLLEDASLHHCLYAPMFLFTSRPTPLLLRILHTHI